MFVCLCLSLCLSDTNQLLSLSDRGWGKNVGFKHRCQFGRGMGGRFSPYSSMCRKTDPLLPRAQSASLPYVRLIDVWLSDCIEIQILSTGAFRYGSTLAFTPAPRITHLMDVLVWTSDWIQTNVHWTPFIQNWILPIWHHWMQLESQSQVDMCLIVFAKQVTIALHLSALKVFIVECFTLFLHITKGHLYKALASLSPFILNSKET